MTTVVVDAADMNQAFAYIIALCEKKPPAIMLVEEPGTAQGPPDPETGLPTRAQRVLGAPDLPAKAFNTLKKLCDAKGWLLLREGLRNVLSGIDIGVNLVAHGIADSGSAIVQTTNEEALISSGISEINVIIIPKSGLLPDMKAAVPVLRDFMNTKTPAGGNYTTIISGSSRTGDIEQVTTLGAHGPIELHMILLED